MREVFLKSTQAELDTGEDTLVYEFFGRNAEEWATDLAAAGVPAAAVNEAPWLQADHRESGAHAAGGDTGPAPEAEGFVRAAIRLGAAFTVAGATHIDDRRVVGAWSDQWGAADEGARARRVRCRRPGCAG